ncbi:MAG: hypothetical protein NVSMB64_11850 [Candidatus Velthaea sp.]
MTLPRERVSVMPLQTLLRCSYAAIGAIGARWYMPERKTFDIDLLIAPESLEVARRSLREHGGRFIDELAFPHTLLGLRGERWDVPNELPVDLIWSDQEWVSDALAVAEQDPTGVRYAPLWAIVVTKLDASRTKDQGDIARVLGFANDAALAETRRRVAELLPDEIDDLETYIRYGRLDVGREADR